MLTFCCFSVVWFSCGRLEKEKQKKIWKYKISFLPLQSLLAEGFYKKEIANMDFDPLTKMRDAFLSEVL